MTSPSSEQGNFEFFKWKSSFFIVYFCSWSRTFQNTFWL